MFSLTRVSGKIWHLKFQTAYDLNLHFFRYQTFYECPRFKKSTNIQFIDLMDWYSHNQGKGDFTYTSDWAGFNMPAEAIFEMHRKGIPDKNRYDDMMFAVAEYIRAKEEGSEDFYIIGTAADDLNNQVTFDHELAHGIYFTNEDYRKEMNDLIELIPKRTINYLYKELKKCGYDDDVLKDEAQAYLSTGLDDSFNTKALNKQSVNFKKVFKKYAKKIKINAFVAQFG